MSIFVGFVTAALVFGVWKWMKNMEYAAHVLLITMAYYGHLMPAGVDRIAYVIVVAAIAKTLLFRPLSTKNVSG